jgi:hypothetical protein
LVGGQLVFEKEITLQSVNFDGFVKSQNFLPAGWQAGLNYSILRIHNVFK